VDQREHVKIRGFQFFLWKRKRKSSIGKMIFVHHRIILAVKRVEFVSDRLSYMVLRHRWCNITVLNGNETSEGKGDDRKGIFMKN